MRPGPNPAPARPSKPPSSSLAPGGCRWRSREGAQFAAASRSSRFTLPPPPPPPAREAHKERRARAHTSRRGPAGRRAGPARSRLLARHCACPGEGRGGTGSGGRARPYHPPGSVRLASGQWPRRARARVWEPAGSQFARQACAEPRGRGAEHSRGHRWRCGSGPPVPPPASGLGIPPTSFRATWGGKCYPRGQKMLGERARASGSVGGRVFCVACVPAQVGSSRPAVTVPWGPGPRALLSASQCRAALLYR